MAGEFRDSGRKRHGGGRARGGRGRDGRPTEASHTISKPPVSDAVVVNGYSEQWLRKGFPWVYSAEIEARPGRLEPGMTVAIRSRSGADLGAGIWDAGKVAVRRFRDDDGPVDRALVAARLAAARGRRLLPPDTTAWRLVHGENDDLPGIRVDVWGDRVAVSLDAPGLLSLLPAVLDGVAEVQPFDAAWLSWRPATDEQDAVAGLPAGLVRGEVGRPEIVVTERGLCFEVDPSRGPDAGLFCDMRDTRSWLEPYLAGRRLLNLFAYTGAFTVAAAVGGAAGSVSVDLSGPSLERCRRNLELNGVATAAHELVEGDVFAVLDRLRRTGERFDLVVADPPSFSHGPGGTWAVEQHMTRLVAAALRVLEPGGLLVAATNNGAVSPKVFGGLVLDGARKAGRPIRLVHQGSQPIDFPALLSFPEARYLKCWILSA